MRVVALELVPQSERRMGSIVKRLNSSSFTCEMCKKYFMGPRYVYQSFFFKEYKNKELIICQKCAKREHGPKNKSPLPELGQK